MAKGEDITTRFKVDISDLKKNITIANQQIKLANSEFKAATSGMDNWRKSSEGLEAKLSQLKTVLTQQLEKLKNYKNQLKEIEKAESENGKRIEEARKQYEKAKEQYGENSTEAKKYAKALSEIEKEQLANQTAGEKLKTTINNQQAAVDGTVRELRNYNTQLTAVRSAETQAQSAMGKLSSEISKQKNELDKAKRAYQDAVIQYGRTSTEARTLENTITNLSRELRINEQNMEQASDAADELDLSLGEVEDSSSSATGGFTILKGALANLVADGFRKAIDASKEFAKSMITTAAEVKAQNSQFEQTFGEFADEATEAIERVANSTGVLDTRLKTTGAQIFAFARSNGATIPEAMSLMETALMASADSAAYYDKSLEDSSETLKSFLKGNYANDAALGVSATEFTRNAKATELFGTEFKNLTEIQKQQTLLKMVTDSQELSGAMGQAAREADGWENVQGNLNETWRQFKAQVGTPFLEALIPIIQKVTQSFTEWKDSVDWDLFGIKVQNACDKIIKGFTWIVENKGLIIGAINAIIAAFIFTKVISGITLLTSALGILRGTLVATEVTQKALTLANNLQTASLLGQKIATIASTTATKAATAAQWLWNAAINANPIGLLIVGVTALTAGIVALVKHENDETKALKDKTLVIQDQTKKIQEQVTARQDLKKSVQETIDNGNAELNYVQSLKSELDGLVDKNGKVKEGYEARAKFITGELSEATGVEIKLIDGQIKEYDKLGEKIDEIIEKKRAQLVMEANEDLYKDAIKTRQNAYNEMYRLENEKNAKLEEIDKKRRQFEDAGNIITQNKYRKQLAELEKQYGELRTQYSAQEELASDNAYIIGKYEQQMVDFQSGKYDEIIANDINLVQHKENKNKTEEEIAKKNYEVAKRELTNLLAEQKKATDDEKALYDSQIETAKKHVEDTKTQLDALTSTVKSGNDDVTKEWRNGVADQLSSLTDKKVEFKDAGNGQVQMYIDGVKTGKPAAEKAMSKFAADTIQKIKDKKMDAKTAGEYLIDGTNEGIKNETKQNGAFSSIANFGKKLLNKLKNSLEEKSPSKATKEMGQYLLEGLGIGIKDEEKPLLNQISNFGEKMIDELQDSLSTNLTIPSINADKIKLAKSNVSSLVNNAQNKLKNSTLGSNLSNAKSNVNNFTQIINAPKQPSRIDLYRQTRNLLELKGVN